jgi:putative membrane protein
VIVKQRLDPMKVVRFVWRPMLWAVAVAIAAVVLRRVVGPQVVVPFGPVGTVGAAVAIFVAFRNNASYARWWEGRTLWSTIHSSCRVFARQVVAATRSAAAGDPGIAEAAEAYRRELVLRLVALAHATRLQLRGEQDRSVLRPLLPVEEFEALLRVHDTPNVLLQTTSERVKDGVRASLLGQFDPISLEAALGALNAAVAGCERLKDTPTPRQYDYFTRLSVAAFATLLPFGLLSVTGPGQDVLVVLLSVVVAGFYVILETVGAIVEAPFAGRDTDVPLTYVCTRIERDLREQLGDAELPAPVAAVDGYLW